MEVNVDKVDNTNSADQLLINHESVTKNWSPMKVNERTNIRLNFNAGLLNQVGNITNCRVELAMDELNITVRGESEQDVDKALAKLNVLNNAVVSCTVVTYSALILKVFRTSMTWIFEFYISEGDLDVVLQMLPLKDSLGRKLSTTLVSAASPHLNLLHNYLTIEVISEGGFDIQSRVQSRPSNRAACRLWREHPYKTYGDGSYNAAIYRYGPGTQAQSNEGSNGTPAKPTIRTVDQWVEQSAAAADNPFVPLHQAEEPPKFDDTADGFQTNPELPVGRTRYIKTRKAKGIPDLPNLAQSVATSCDSRMPVNSASSSRSPSKSGSKTGEEYGSQRNDDSASTEPSVVGAVIPNLVPPPIEPPFMPDPSVASNELVARATWEAHIVPNVRANTSLLGFDPDEPQKESPEEPLKVESKQSPRSFDIEEKVQQVNEFETRQIRYTMNQRKASTQVGSGTTALLRSFESKLTQILRCTRSFVGHVRLRVNIGRILINHQTGSAESKKQPFVPNQWPRVFPAQGGTSNLETVFTEM